MASYPTVEGRKAFVVGVGRFESTLRAGEEVPAEHEVWGPLDFVYDVVPAVEKSLLALGYQPECFLDPRAAEVRDVEARISDEEVRVVYAVSHGRTGRTGDQGRVDLVPACTRLGAGTNVSNWVSTAQAGHRPTLFLLDLCGAGRAARLPFLVAEAGRDTHAWVIAGAGGDEDAYDGRFGRCVAEVLEEVSRTGLGTDSTRRYVSFPVVAREIRARVERLPGLPQTVHSNAVDASLDEAEPPFFPNPRYREDAAEQARQRLAAPVRGFIDDLAAQHFTDKPGVHFTGRRGPLGELVPWFGDTEASGLRVVTGSPGVGKSALLGALACAAHRNLAEIAPYVRARLLPEQRPPFLDDLALVHARNRGTAEVVRTLADQWGLPEPDGGWSVPALVDAVSEFDRPAPLLVDALDEALAPKKLMNDLLPLVRARRGDGRPICRVLVGTRPWGMFRPLLDFANVTLDLDQVDVRADLEEFICASLADIDVYADHEPVRAALAEAASGRLYATAGEWGAFLVAQVFLRYLIFAPAALDVTAAAELGATVPATLPEVFDLDLRGRTDGAAVRAVLKAVAHAKGEGMPADLLARLVPAFRPDLASDRVQRLLDDSRFYLRTAVETDGTTLYRLFHQGLADHLAQASSAVVHQHLAVESWAVASPYLLRHALEHAHDAGQMDALVESADFLVHAEPSSVLALLDEARSVDSFHSTSVYRVSVGVHRMLPPDARAQVLAINAARFEHAALQTAFSAAAISTSWCVRWATGSNITRYLRQSMTHVEGVTALCSARVNGRVVVLAGGLGGGVGGWDAVTGGPVVRSFDSQGRGMTGLDVAVVAGVPVAVTIADGTVLVWELESGTVRHVLVPAHPGGPVTVRCAEVGGAAMAVVGVGATVEVWDLESGRLSHAFGTLARIGALLTTESGGHTLVVTTPAHAPGVDVWDVASGRRVRRFDCEVVDSLSSTEVGGERVLVGASLSSGQIACWSLVTGVRLRVFSAGPITCMASAERRGRLLVLTASGPSGVLSVWDCDQSATPRTVLKGHSAQVHVLAVTSVANSTVLLSGGLDGVVRLWDLPADLIGLLPVQEDEIATAVPGAAWWSGQVVIGHQTGELAWRHIGSRSLTRSAAPLTVPAPAHNLVPAPHPTRRVLLTWGGWGDWGICVRDLDDHTYDLRFDGHGEYASGVACTEVEGGVTAVSTGSLGEVLRWDLDTCQVNHVFRAGGGGTSRPAVVATGGRHLAAVVVESAPEEVVAWDLLTGEEVCAFPIGEGMRVVRMLEWGGKAVVVAAAFGGAVSGPVPESAAQVTVYDLVSGDVVCGPLSGHTGWVEVAAAARHGTAEVLVTGGRDGALRVWDEHGHLLEVLVMPGVVTRLDTGLHGTLVVVAEGDVIVLEPRGVET